MHTNYAGLNALRPIRCSQGIHGKHIFRHRHSTNKVFLDNAFKDFRRAVPIPRALRINHRHRPLHAHPQTPGFGAENVWFWSSEAQFL